MSKIYKTQRDSVISVILERMETDSSIVFLSADFGSPVLDEVRARYPQRFINVGIAEQNLVNIATGLALEGHKVFAYAIAPFLTMRAYEQIRTNLAVLGTVRPLNVNLIGVGAGYSYVVSGPTHQCFEDLTIMRAMPNFHVLSPSDSRSAARLANYCIDKTGVKYLRLDAQPLEEIYAEGKTFHDEGVEVINDGSDDYQVDGVIISTGYTTHTALKAQAVLKNRGKHVKVVDILNLSKATDSVALSRSIRSISGGGVLVSVEEGFKGKGGLDSLIFNFLASRKICVPYTNLGVDNGYNFELDSRETRHNLANIGISSIVKCFSGRA